jgi:hypothetical protein
MHNTFTAKSPIGRFVNLQAPVVQIIGVHFRGIGPDVPPVPYYTILEGGQQHENVPESAILGVNDEAQQRDLEQRAAQEAVNRAAAAGEYNPDKVVQDLDYPAPEDTVV